jgi:hypothetical protein
MDLPDVSPDPLVLERAGYPQRPRERATAFREIKACRVGVQVRPPARHATAWVWQKFAIHHDDTQQVGPRRSSPAAHTGAYGRSLDDFGVRIWQNRLRTARHDESIPLRP